MVLGQMDSLMQQNEGGLLPHTTYKNKLKMDQRTKLKATTIKLLQGNIGVSLCNLGLGNDFLVMTPKHWQPNIK